jgi:dimethylargininase
VHVTTVDPTFQAPFVGSDYATLRGAFVVAPGLAIAGMLPVQAESSPIAERAAEQFRIFVGRLGAAGVAATVVDVDPTLLGWAVADTAVVFEEGAFLMRPSDVRRRPEISSIEDALARANVPIVGRIEPPGLLDGGDVLVSGDTVYIGHTVTRASDVGLPVALHGNAFGREQLAAYARAKGRRVVDVTMAGGVRSLRVQKIEAPRGEDYGAGVLVLGNRRVVANLRFRETIPLLRAAKVAVDAIDLWEFGKIGVTPSTLALALKRG